MGNKSTNKRKKSLRQFYKAKAIHSRDVRQKRKLEKVATGVTLEQRKSEENQIEAASTSLTVPSAHSTPKPTYRIAVLLPKHKQIEQPSCSAVFDVTNDGKEMLETINCVNTSPVPLMHSTPELPHRQSVKPLSSDVVEGGRGFPVKNHALQDHSYSRHIEKEEVSKLPGTRLVDIRFFFSELKRNKELHVKALECSFTDMEPIDTHEVGLRTWLTMQCQVCNLKDNIRFTKHTKLTNVNSKAVAGSIAIGTGREGLNELLSFMNVPPMSAKTYDKEERKIAEAVKILTNNEMVEVGKEEARHAVATGRISSKGIPLVAVKTDGSWCKRSYRTNYNAKSGMAAIIGCHTGKVLFMGERNKLCEQCSRPGPKVDHKCFRNWDGSSTAMESSIILEGFKASLQTHGIIYDKLIGDGDSSVYKTILKARPYGSDIIVEKIECRLHLMRNMRTKIMALKTCKLPNEKNPKMTRKIISTLKRLVASSSERFTIAVTKASEYCRHEAGTTQEKVTRLQKDIENIPFHLFGRHSSCRSYFCDGIGKAGNIDFIGELQEIGLFSELIEIMNRMSANASSILEHQNTNACESLNSIVNKLIGGKRTCLSRRGKYVTRTRCSIASFNTRRLATGLHRTMDKDSPGSQTKKFEEARIKKVEGSKKRKLTFADPIRKKRGAVQWADEDYGDVQPLPEDESELTNLMFQHLFSIFVSDEDIKHIEAKTRRQASSSDWKLERAKRLSASKFGRILSLKSETATQAAVKEITGSFFPTAAMSRGSRLEARAKEKFMEMTGLSVQPAGLFIDHLRPYLAASPDGIIPDVNALLEVKCPETANKCDSLKQAVTDKKITFLELKEDEITLRKNSQYYWQIQGQLNITGKNVCYLVVHTDHWTEYVMVERDEHVWEAFMVPKLTWFYMHALLPELVSPRYNGKDAKSIRESTMKWDEKFALRPSIKKIKAPKKKTKG